MALLKTANNTIIQCEAVIRGNQYPVLHIYTHDITPVQAYQIFGDPEITETLVVTEERVIPVKMEDGTTITQITTVDKTYTGFTEVFSVQKAALYQQPGEILIWLQKPAENS